MNNSPKWTGPPSTTEIHQALHDARTVAVVGASDKPSRPSHGVAAYLLQRAGYEVWPVNPHLTTLLGRTVYPSLADLPAPPDIVNVFRRRSELVHIADQAVAAHARVLWFQLGLYDEAAATSATAAGLTVVMDRCIKIDHAALIGPTS